MKLEIRIPGALYHEALEDLRRPHPHAYERVGFFSSAVKLLSPQHCLVLLSRYHPVPDEYYLEDPSVGALIGVEAITAAMQRTLSEVSGQLHVHLHEHRGQPRPSVDDIKGLPPIVRSLSATAPLQASGYLIFSQDRAWSEVMVPGQAEPQSATKISVVGFPTKFLK
jgi:hypothetical protein